MGNPEFQAQEAASVVFVGQFEARIGRLRGLLQMVVREIDEAPDLYSAPVPGERPNFVLDRQFRSSNCPATSCGDLFVVQIHPVE